MSQAHLAGRDGRLREGEVTAEPLALGNSDQDLAFDLIRSVLIFETLTDHFLRDLDKGTVATNLFLLRLHSFAADLGGSRGRSSPNAIGRPFGLPRSALSDPTSISPSSPRSATPKCYALFELCWQLGGSQGDFANLSDDVNQEQGVVSYRRYKAQTVAMLHFGDELAAILRQLPVVIPFFPYRRTGRAVRPRYGKQISERKE